MENDRITSQGSSGGTVSALGGQESSFDRAAEAQIRAVQAAWLDLFASVDLSGARPTAISRGLEVDKTLAWKLSRFAGEQDAGKAFRHLPGDAGVEIMFQAVADHGGDRDQINAVRRAVADLRRFVKAHAGDRRTFEAMVHSNKAEGRSVLEDRRQLYRASSAIWGVRAVSQILTIILRPSEQEEGKLDVVQLGGLVELERLRPEVPWIVRRLRASNDDDSDHYRIRRQPLDDSLATEIPTPLLLPYCSKPAPRIRQFTDENGWVYDELEPGTVGRSGATTCVLGEKHLAVLPMHRSEENTAGRYSLTVRTPVQSAVFDLLLHKDLVHFSDAQMFTFGLLEGRPTAGGGTRHSLPLYDPEPARQLGSPALVQSARHGWYSSMVQDALGRAGWGTLASYRGYRMEVEYPAIPCDLTMVCEIERV
ncbi:MAG: hypothetical protein Phyf2KO_18690 [Phycisphaerales bacterium]